MNSMDSRAWFATTSALEEKIEKSAQTGLDLDESTLRKNKNLLAEIARQEEYILSAKELIEDKRKEVSSLYEMGRRSYNALTMTKTSYDDLLSKHFEGIVKKKDELYQSNEGLRVLREDVAKSANNALAQIKKIEEDEKFANQNFQRTIKELTAKCEQLDDASMRYEETLGQLESDSTRYYEEFMSLLDKSKVEVETSRDKLLHRHTDQLNKLNKWMSKWSDTQDAVMMNIKGKEDIADTICTQMAGQLKMIENMKSLPQDKEKEYEQAVNEVLEQAERLDQLQVEYEHKVHEEYENTAQEVKDRLADINIAMESMSEKLDEYDKILVDLRARKTELQQLDERLNDLYYQAKDIATNGENRLHDMKKEYVQQIKMNQRMYSQTTQDLTGKRINYTGVKDTQSVDEAYDTIVEENNKYNPVSTFDTLPSRRTEPEPEPEPEPERPVSRRPLRTRQAKPTQTYEEMTNITPHTVRQNSLYDPALDRDDDINTDDILAEFNALMN